MLRFMFRPKLILIPVSTLCVCTVTESGYKQAWLMLYIFGIRVAAFHLDRIT